MASNANDVVNQLKNFLKIFKKKQVFERSNDHLVIQFFYLKDFFVNIRCSKKKFIIFAWNWMEK